MTEGQMKPGFEEVEPRAPRLADNITDQSVRDIYARMLGVLRNLHDDVEVNESNVDVRASCGATFICRLVPYRELIHAQIGGSPKWEIRIRSENDSNEAIERILGTFLKSLSGVHAPASAQSELNSG